MKSQYFGCAAIFCVAIVNLSGCSSMGSGFLSSGLQSTFDRSPELSAQSPVQPVSYESPLAGYAGRGNGITITAANTQVEFTGTAGPMKKSGHFNRISGSFAAPSANQPGAIDVMIDMDSLETGNWLLTKHLKSRDFFDVKQFSTSRFVSTAIRPTQQPDQYAVTGQLTIHGVTRSIEAPAKIIAYHEDEGSQLRMDFTIRQTDFGMERGAKKTRNEVPVSITAKIPVLR